jgi:hypothetical protein
MSGPLILEAPARGAAPEVSPAPATNTMALHGVDSVSRSGAAHHTGLFNRVFRDMSIRQIVDESRLSPLQIVVIGVCFFLNMLDGMDVLAISFAAPVIAGDWGISRSALGIAFSAALVGMALGAVVI